MEERKIQFQCDYTEGADPAILQKMLESNMEQTVGYGLDSHCEHAKMLIKKWIGREDVDIHFLVGGTQTNTTVIDSVLRPYQCVLAAKTGHINVHETGAIEATGHKVEPLEAKDGKIDAKDLTAFLERYWADSDAEHMVQPGMLYLSQPTEYGTLYSKKELEEFAAICKKYGICFYIDGARLGYGLAATANDCSIEELARLADIFYIGGTKVGALFGEAVVITNPSYKKDFRYQIKRHGGMLAKGRLLGIQFECLMEDNRYMEIATHAARLAEELKRAFLEKGYELFLDSPTNQQFVILSKEQKERLEQKYVFSLWEPLENDRYAVRFCTSWATKEADVKQLISDL